MSVVKTLIETQEFATLPVVASKILALIDDDNVNLRDIAKVIEADASLTLKLLRVANSPLYASRTEVSSIQQAIVTLGLNRLTNIVLGVSIFSKFLMSSNKEAQALMQKFWWHSSCTGMVAKSLSTKVNLFFKETEFIGGLLHDIGKLAMLQFDTTKYLEVIRLVNEEGKSDLEAEVEVFGATHPEVGAAIAKLWKLPNDLHDVIENHTHPENAVFNKSLVACVRVSDILSEVWDAGFYEGIKMVAIEESSSWKILTENHKELQEIDVEKLTFELEKDYKKSTEFLNIISTDV